MPTPVAIGGGCGGISVRLASWGFRGDKAILTGLTGTLAPIPGNAPSPWSSRGLGGGIAQAEMGEGDGVPSSYEASSTASKVVLGRL